MNFQKFQTSFRFVSDFMQYTFAVIILLFISLPLHSNSYTDSLEQKAILLEYYFKKEFSEELTQIYITLNKEYISSNPVLALEYGEKALRIAEKNSDVNSLSTIHNHFGNVYRQQGYYELALRHFYATHKFNEQLKDYNGIIYSYNDIGNIYFDKQEYSKALENYNSAYELSLTLPHVRPRAVSLNNIGLVQLTFDNFEKAIECFEKSLQYRIQFGDLYLIAHSHNYLGYTYALIGNKQLANEHFDKAISLYARSNNHKEVVNVYRYKIFLFENDLEKAEYYFSKADSINIQFNDRYRRINLHFEIARIFENAGLYETAIQYVQKSIDLAQTDFPINIQKGYELLASIYKTQGKFAMAFSAFEKYHIVKDSIHVNDISQLYTQIQTHYQLKQKELELAESEKIKTLQKAELSKTKLFYQILTILFVVLLVFIGFITFSYYQKVQTNRQLQLKKDIIESQKEEILKNNEELKKAKELAESSAAAKGQFLSNITHEIRTPMSGIIGMAELLIQKHPEETFTNQLKSIKFSGEKLLSIINDILSFSKLESNEVQLEHIPFNLDELTTELVKSVEINKSSDKVTLQLDLQESTPINLIGDPTKLYQVLLNLVGNALKFTENGHVKVSVATTPEIYGNKQKLKFTIEDTGIGIESDKLETIFESFKQAGADIHRKYGGTGLGLSIVKKIIEIHNGTIDVTSEIGKGTTFTIFMEFEVDNGIKTAENDIQIPSEIVINPLAGLKVLLADDNPLNLEVSKRLLMQAGAKVFTYTDGIHLLKNAEQKDPDLIILDLEMPLMDGIECAAKLRKIEQFSKEHFTIIGLTANIFPEAKENALAAGMDFLLTKPLKVNLLKKTLLNSKKGKVLLATG